MDDEAKKTVEDNRGFDSLPSVKDGTAKIVDADFTTAVNGASPASLDWLIPDSGSRAFSRPERSQQVGLSFLRSPLCLPGPGLELRLHRRVHSCRPWCISGLS